MATATASFNVSRRSGQLFTFPVAAATLLYQGVFGALDGNNRLVSATDAAARRVVGLIETQTDNSTGGAGDLSCNVETGLFLINNSVANPVTNAHIGRAAFVEDDNTVASAEGTNNVVAGIVAQVDEVGVWLWVGVPHSPVAPVAVTLTSTDGTAGAAADLAALKAETEKVGDDLRALHAALQLTGLIK